MNTLIIYDNTGYVIDVRSGDPAPREPIGIPFIWVDIPTGKQIKVTNGIGVDVSVTPNVVILEDIPKTDIELIQEQLQATQEAVDFLVMGGIYNGSIFSNENRS